MSRAVKARAATNQQIATLRSLGYQKLSLVYSSDEAERLIAKLREEVPPLSTAQRQEQARGTAWHKGQNLLALGYRFETHPTEPYTVICHRPNGEYTKTASRDRVNHYLIKLGATKEGDECSCDYFTAPGHANPCCHLIGFWKWCESLEKEKVA